jgi:hypothetical protein
MSHPLHPTSQALDYSILAGLVGTQQPGSHQQIGKSLAAQRLVWRLQFGHISQHLRPKIRSRPPSISRNSALIEIRRVLVPRFIYCLGYCSIWLSKARAAMGTGIKVSKVAALHGGMGLGEADEMALAHPLGLSPLLTASSN